MDSRPEDLRTKPGHAHRQIRASEEELAHGYIHCRQDRTTRPDRPFRLKTKQHGAWSSGDYAVVGTTLQIVGEELCEALDLRAGQKCSTSPPATATPRSPPRAAGAR